jgi:dolichol-phosphate mannosyltransferase
MPEVSVVVPVFDEADVLPALFERLCSALDATDVRWELVFVDDGSRDASASILRDLAAREPRVVVVTLSRNFGHQLAITAGMDHARGEAIVVMDADLQDPPEVVPDLIARWREGYDVVYGVRTARDEDTVFKRVTAAGFYRVLQWLTPIPIPVDAGDFRLMSRRALSALQRMPERARYVRGMVAWLGYRQTAVPFERAPRRAGETKYPLRKMVAFAADGIVSFSAVPLRLATSLGFVMAATSLVYVLYAVSMKLLVGTAIQGWTSLVAVIVLIGSAQLICLGIIGEYVARIYEEVKGRPLYLVDEVVRARDER